MSFDVICLAAWGLASSVQAGPLPYTLPPEAYRDPVDQEIARTGKGIPGRPFPCAYEEKRNGVDTIESQPTELCEKMSPARRFHGLWRAGVESSRFCPQPAETCDSDTPGDYIWLSRYPGRLRGELYRVDFIGRQTLYRRPWGLPVAANYEITMDQVIKMELISKPKAPSKASVEEMKKNCAAKPGCDVKALISDLKAIY